MSGVKLLHRGLYGTGEPTKTPETWIRLVYTDGRVTRQEWTAPIIDVLYQVDHEAGFEVTRVFRRHTIDGMYCLRMEDRDGLMYTYREVSSRVRPLDAEKPASVEEAGDPGWGEYGP